MRYTLIQRSIWSGFTLDILDGSGRAVGEVLSPTLFQFKNARLGFHAPGSTAGNVKFRFEGVAYEACVEVLRRAFVNDVRYTLEKDGQVLAAVDILRKRRQRFPAVVMYQPLQGTFEATGRLWSRRFDLVDGTQVRASVFHPHRFTLRAQLAVEITGSEPALPLVFAAYVIKELLY
jgi:hypothetical protein